MESIQCCLIILTGALTLAYRAWASRRLLITTACGISGAAIAHVLLAAHRCTRVRVEPTGAERYGCYRAVRGRRNTGTVVLSADWYYGKDACAVAVAAHEVGHAIQHRQRHLSFQLSVLLNRCGANLAGAGLICFLVAIIAERVQFAWCKELFGISLCCMVVHLCQCAVTAWTEAAANNLAVQLLQTRGELTTTCLQHARTCLWSGLVSYLVPVVNASAYTLVVAMSL